MPFFKSTKDILITPWEDEVFDQNWMDSDKLILPPYKVWDYSRPLQIEDIDIWEVIFERGGGYGLYAAWNPYAEFYLLTCGLTNNQKNRVEKIIETYYGPKCQFFLKKRLDELGIKVATTKIWVDPEDMWLYENKDYESKTLVLP